MMGKEETLHENPGTPIPPVNPKQGPPADFGEKYLPYLYYPPGPLFDAIRRKFLQEIEKMEGLSRVELQQEFLTWFSLRREDFDRMEAPEPIERAQVLVFIMTDFLASKRPLATRGIIVSHEELLVRFLKLDREDLMEVEQRIAKYMDSDRVENPITYTLSSIYNQSITSCLSGG